MAGEVEESFRFNFQADLLNSGSISFGRFESESLSWERRSSFSHNRYLEEVEKYSKPGSVTEKKAYFEAHFKRKALLKQSSSESQDGREFPTTEFNDLQESEIGNESKHFTCFDESSPHSSGHFSYDKETEIQLCAENTNLNSVDHTITGPDHLKLEETHQIGYPDVEVVKSEEITEMTHNDSVVMIDVASEMKQPKPKQKAVANSSRVSRIVSSDASSNVTSKTKIMEIKSLPMKEKVKKSPKPASFPKTRLPPQNKRSEMSLPGARETANRTKPTIQTPSKPHVSQIATGFTFKSDQRAERRKEEKRVAAETTQSRKSLNFKATPMPSFYKESSRSSDLNKAISSSKAKTPTRPRTASMVPSTKKVSSNPASSSNPRPGSSASLINRNRLPEPSRKVQEKKKDLNLQKQKEHEAIIGSRVRESKGVHSGTGVKLGYLAVRVAT